MSHVQGHLKCSQRRVCRALGERRSTQRSVASSPRDDAGLVRRIEEIVRRHPRRGYRMVCGSLQDEGIPVNHKRVYRQWRSEGLSVPRKHDLPPSNQSTSGVVLSRWTGWRGAGHA